MLRKIAEKIANNYREDWGENERIKEACICSVENTLALLINLVVLTILAILLSKEKEYFLFFLVNGILRTYSGGIHAPTHTKCTLYYFAVMLTSVYLAEQLGAMSMVLSLCSLPVSIYSFAINHRYGGMQKHLAISENKKYNKFSQVLSLFVCGFLLIVSWTDYLCGGILQNSARAMLWIICFAMLTQSTALYLAREKCYTEKGKVNLS